MVMMGSYIPNLHHIGPEFCGSRSYICGLSQKLSLSLVKHCLRFKTPTKPIKIPD